MTAFSCHPEAFLAPNQADPNQGGGPPGGEPPKGPGDDNDDDDDDSDNDHRRNKDEEEERKVGRSSAVAVGEALHHLLLHPVTLVVHPPQVRSLTSRQLRS